MNRILRLVCLITALGFAAASAQERVPGPLPSLAPLVATTAPAVVNIAVTELVESRASFFGGRRAPPELEALPEGQPRERLGAGSGVIVDADNGYVLTNHHVIASASEILVTLVDRRNYYARVVGSDPNTDLAVLQIEAENLTAIPFASTADLQVGDYVVAIGNPFGLGQTVTSGIVSALGRIGGFTNDAFEDYIQTDASINPGNSGGALINLDGELIGINSAIISTGFSGGNVGIGFAIPSEMAVSVMGRLLEFGEVRRGLLGVMMETITPSLASDVGLPVGDGALVTLVNLDSAAERAGVRIYDVIVGIDGQRIGDGNELRNRVAMKLPGEAVDVLVLRDGRERTLRAVLDAREVEETARIGSATPESRRAPALLDGVELVAERGQRPGIRVQSIERSSPAAGSDLRPGDLITAINQRPVESVADVRLMAAQTRTVLLEIERDSRTRLLVIP